VQMTGKPPENSKAGKMVPPGSEAAAISMSGMLLTLLKQWICEKRGPYIYYFI
jgi:hypothetical protein